MKSISRQLNILIALGVAAACGDDSGSSQGAGAAGTTSSGAPECTTPIYDGSNAPCPAECAAQVYGGAATFCTEPCTGPDDPCPSGTQCLPNVFDSYASCLPPCTNGTCPDKMHCDPGGKRCEPD